MSTHDNLISLISKGTERLSDGGMITFLNPYSYLVARKNKKYFRKMTCVKCDGVALCALMNLIGIKVKRESFDMTSLAKVVFSDAVCRRRKVYLIGGREGVAEDAANTFKAHFPNLDIIGTHGGYFKSQDEMFSVAKSIASKGPDICVVGMGTPYQERFLCLLADVGWRGTGYTCGGFLHQTSRLGIRYYPHVIDKFNLRWLYRMFREPRVIFRVLFMYPLFLIVFIIDSVDHGFRSWRDR